MRFSELIAIYLFMGGVAAGSFAVLALADLYQVVKNRFEGARFGLRTRLNSAGTTGATEATGATSSFASYARYARAHSPQENTFVRVRTLTYGTALIAIIIGSLCLIADLGRPENFYYLFLYPTITFISVGAFALVALAICSTIALCETIFAVGPAIRRLAIVAKCIGVPAAAVTMVYTGLLLESMVSVPMWQSPWLPALFCASALSCGCAVVMISVCASENMRLISTWGKNLAYFDAALVVAEIVSLTLFLLNILAASPASLEEMLTGHIAPVYWLGFVGCSLVAPLCVEISQMFLGHKIPSAILCIVAAMILIGGLCLRLALVSAGVQVVN